LAISHWSDLNLLPTSLNADLNTPELALCQILQQAFFLIEISAMICLVEKQQIQGII